MTRPSLSCSSKPRPYEAIKYVVKEYPRFCTHYKQEAKEHGELKRKYREQGEAVRGFLSALDRLEKAGREKE